MDVQWRVIDKTSGFYEVSNMGNVRSWVRSGRTNRPHDKADEPHPIKNSIRYAGYAGCNIRFDYGLRHKYVHKLVLEAFVGEQEGMFVDHINRNKLDNRLCNLRYCSPVENTYNRKGTKATSRYKGVYLNDGLAKPWVAQIGKERACIVIGTYATEKEAAFAYDVVATIMHGEFAVLNFHGVKLGVDGLRSICEATN